MAFGYTEGGRYIACVYEWIDDIMVEPITAYSLPPAGFVLSIDIPVQLEDRVQFVQQAVKFVCFRARHHPKESSDELHLWLQQRGLDIAPEKIFKGVLYELPELQVGQFVQQDEGRRTTEQPFAKLPLCLIQLRQHVLGHGSSTIENEKEADRFAATWMSDGADNSSGDIEADRLSALLGIAVALLWLTGKAGSVVLSRLHRARAGGATTEQLQPTTFARWILSFPVGKTIIGGIREPWNDDMSQPATLIAPHIERVPGRCGGKPCVAGTRIRVWDIHVWHDLRGMSPAEIVVHFPQLSLADVHAALTYYLDHREEIESQMKAAEQAVERLAAEQGSTKLSRLRDAVLLKEPADDGDPVSSG